MTYTGDTPILGHGTVSAEAIDAWFAARGPAAAKSFAPDKTYRPAPAGLGQIIVDECRRWSPQIVNHDLIAADIAHESAFWQSRIVRDKHNPSGLGAVNDNAYGGAVAFPGPREGVRATVAHMLSYAVGAGPWDSSDPRFAAVKSAGWLGTAPLLKGLNGKWAHPGTTYGQGIARIANELVDFAEHGIWDKPMPTTTIAKPKMTIRPSPNRDGYAEPRKIEAICNHIATSTKASNLGWLTNPKSEASCNYYIAKDGEIFELVPYDHSAWTNGQVRNPDMNNPLIASWVNAGVNPNTRTVSIEHEGEASDALTEAQVKSNNHLTAWLSQTCGIPINRTTIIGHYQIDSVQRSHCPSFSPDEWTRLIAGAQALLAKPETPRDAEIFIVPGIGSFVVGGGFYQAWRRDGGLARHGYPLTDEMQEDGRTVQYFERARLEHHPNVANDNWNVLYGRLGAELLEARQVIAQLRARIAELDAA